MQTLTEKQVKEKYGQSGIDAIRQNSNNPQPQIEKEAGVEPGYFSRVMSSFKKAGENIKTSGSRALERADQATQDGSVGGTLKGFGELAKGAVNIAGEVAGSAFTPIMEAPGIKQASEALGGAIANNDTVKGLSALIQKNPEEAQLIQNAINLLTLGGGKAIETPLSTGIKTATDAAERAVTQAGAKAIATAKDVAGNVLQPIADVTRGVVDATKLAGEGLSRIPARIGTNLAENKAVQESIKALPSQSARRAVQDGVDIADVQYFTQIPKAQKAPVATLVKSVQEFAEGKTKVDPREIVGKPAVQAFEALKSKQSVAGKKLGEIANTLNEPLGEAQTFYPVYDRLKTVNGLEGLKLTDEGKLDFTDTVLTTAETASDRSAIESIFNSAVQSGTGKQKHLLRQELRETLGGKKKGGVQLTGTQENAYEAVRKGLSDVLDTINPEYKKVNMEYAKVSEPLRDMAKALKVAGEVDDDVINLSAGLLARRLTSQSVSNPQIRQLFNRVDKALATEGKTLTSLETLQDTLNVLSKYYDIDPKTGFKAQTQEAISSGVGDFISGAVKGIAGKTEAVRKKAFENMLKELLSN